MRLKSVLPVSFLYFLIVVSMVDARILTVGTASQEYATITGALSAAVTGDVVVVYPGTYQEQLILKEGVVLKSFDQGSDGTNDFFFKSGITIIDGGGNSPVVRLADDSRLEGFTITGGDESGFAVHGYFVTAEVVGNRIVNNAGAGLYLLGDGLIHKNRITGNGGNGLEIAYSEASVQFNSIGHNSGDGIRATESPADIRNNIIAFNGTVAAGSAGVRVVGTGLSMLDYNDVFENLDVNYQNCTAGANSLSDDPLWDSSYRIPENSPCYDAGVDTGAGYPVWAAEPDMGFFEFAIPPLPCTSVWGVSIILLLIGGLMKMKRSILFFLIAFFHFSNPELYAQDYHLLKTGGDGQNAIPGQSVEEALSVLLTESTLIEPWQDAYVRQSSENDNYNTEVLWFGNECNFGPCWIYTYIRFDDPAITYNVLDVSFLRVYCWESIPYPNLSRVWLYKVTSNWSEDSVTWNTQPDMELVDGYLPISSGSYNYYDIELDWVFGSQTAEYGIGLFAIGDGHAYWAQIYSSEWSIENERPKLSVVTDDPDLGMPGETIVFDWSTSQYGSYTHLDSLTTNSDGEAEWSGPMPNVEGDIWIRSTCSVANIGSPAFFQIHLENPVITGTVTTSGFPGMTPVGAGINVRIINILEGIDFTVQTDSNGVYSTEDNPAILPLGTYQVIVSMEGCVESMVTVEITEPGVFTRDIPLACTMVKGKVRSLAAPVRDALVTLNPGGETRLTSTEGDYLFIVEPASLPQTYTVEVEKNSQPVFPDPATVILTETNPIGVANFCMIESMANGSPGDDYVYYPEHFSTPGFDANHVNLTGMPEESIDTFTGKVNLIYSDLSLPGKGGLDLNIIRTYSSCIRERVPWADDHLFLQQFVPETALGLGWDIHFGKILNRLSETPVIVMPDGSRHAAYSVPGSDPLTGFPKYTSELWKLERVHESGLSYDLLLTTTNGIHYYFDRSAYWTESNLVECWTRECAAVTEIRSADADDTNGDRISIHYGVAGDRQVVDYVVDTYGRTVEFDYDVDFLGQIHGPNDSVLIDYSVTEFADGKHALESVIAYAAGTGGSSGDMVTTYSYETDIGIPTFGVMTGIMLPTGGSIAYVYEEHPFYLKAFEGPNVYDRTYVDIALSSRTASGSDVESGTTVYRIAEYSPLDQDTIVTDPLGHETRYRYWNYYSADPGDIAEWKIGLAAEIVHFDGAAAGGTAVRTETRSYESRRLSRDMELNLGREYVQLPVVTRIDTILHGNTKGEKLLRMKPDDRVDSADRRLIDADPDDSGSTELISRAAAASHVDYHYSGSDGTPVDLQNFQHLGMPESVTEFDFAGSPVRTTRFVYVWEPSCPGYEAFRAANFLNGVYRQELIAGDTGGTVVSRTESAHFSTSTDPRFTRLQTETRWADPASPASAVTVDYDYYTTGPESGNLHSITDAESKVTTFQWSAGTISQITTPQLLPDMSYMTFMQTIDPDTGRVTGMTDPNGITTGYSYDDLGRLTGITPPLDQPTMIAYDISGKQVTSVQGSVALTVRYDDLGRLIQTVTPGDQGASHVNQEYDAAGNLNFVSEASFSSSVTDGTAYLYGPLNRVTQAIDPDGTTSWIYDGNVVEITRDGQVTTKTVDALGRMSQIEDATGKVFDYTYDVMDNLIHVTHPNDVTCADRVFVYDGLGRLNSETHPETGTATYTYYDSGQVETITKASGRMASFTYDALYRPTLQTSGSGADAIEIEFYYDGRNDELGYGGSYLNPINHRTGAIVRKGASLDEESRIVWPWFDDQGRNLRKESVLASPSLTSVMQFEYTDGLGNLTSIHYPDGYVTADYTYGAATNLLTGVSVTGSGGTFNFATSLSHNPAGGLESVTFGNGFITTVTPDVRNRPATWVTGIGLDDLLNNDFVYDAFGNITAIGSDVYGYDNLNRLTTSTVNGTSFGCSYDSVGNIETVTKGGSPAGIFSYSQNRITGLSYDDDGNLTDDCVNTYVYDALGQTVSITNSGGTVSYRYDALGKRISANDGSIDTVYAYLGEQLIAEFDNTTYTNSVFLEGQLLARVTDNGVDTTTVRYAHLNHLGSPVAFTDGTAAVVWPEQVGGAPYEIHNYEPFGADFDDIGTPALSPQDVRYTGKLFESETGKHYFNARYLNAVTDTATPELPPRFLSPDIVIGTPESPQSWNRYASCHNNPVRFIDPDGLEGEEAAIAWRQQQRDAALGRSRVQGEFNPGYNPEQEIYRLGKKLGTDLTIMAVSGPVTEGAVGFLDEMASKLKIKSVWRKIASLLSKNSTVKGAGNTDEAFHYTFSRFVSSIERQGLRAGSYASPTGTLSPLQAQIDLALTPNRGLRDALIRVDLAGLRQAGYEIPNITQVGRSFGMPGGGFEMQFPYSIPPQFLKVIQP